MLETPEAVFEALRENNERPYGLPRTVTAEELVEAAEQFDEKDALVTALLELMSAYEYAAEHRKSPVVFARVLKLWDEVPGSFSEWEARQVLWRHKWVATSLLQVPEVPLSAIHGWIDQMRERYRDAEHGQQPVAAMRHRVAAHTGVDREHVFDLWATRPREALSDCEACETRHRAVHHLVSGDDGRALEVWQPVLDGGQSCQEEPWVSQAHALLPLLRLGRTDEARSYHLSGYRRARGRIGMAEEVGLHLEFCALSGNEGRALEILAENRPLFETTGAPLSLLGFLTGVQVLLRRLTEDGHVDVPVSGPLGRSWTARTLLAHVEREADELTAAFDERNGTTTVGDGRRARLAARPLLAEPLELGLRTAAVPSASGGSATPLRPAAAPAEEIPEDFAELVERARAYAAQARPGDERLWRRIAERVEDEGHAHDPRLGPEEVLRAELAEQRAFTASDLADGPDRPAIREALTEAIELFGRAGAEWRALAARARRASVGVTPGEESAEGWVELDAVLARARELPQDGSEDDRRSYCVVLQCRAFLAYTEAAEALPDVPAEVESRFRAAAQEAIEEAERLGVAQRAINVRLYRGDLAARSGDFEGAERELRAALEAIDSAGAPWRAQRPHGRLGQILMQQHRPDEAVEHLRMALAAAAAHGDTSFPVARTHAMLGHALSHAGDLAGAVRHLSEGASRLDREDDAAGAVEVRLELADVLARADRQADAVAVLESLVTDDVPAGTDERVLAQARLSLARGLRELEEHRSAAEQFLLLADMVAPWEEQFTHTLAASEAAVALLEAGRPDAARSAYDRAVASHGKAPNLPMVAEMMRQFAAHTMASEGPEGIDTALGHLREAEELLAAVDEGTEDIALWYENGATRYQRGRALASAERFPEALAEMERAISAHEAGGPAGELPRAEAVRVAALIEANGLESPAAARARLGAAIARCQAAGLDHAAQILTRLREELAAPRR
ncbi:tetratricopeptide repeat protein [Streptomyces sp. NPDC002574]|uniref:tetratricopeptide repeat protein n=1 Tax=Streptomyces sp. NPDC002574 TaxID=3364652 RepID=UPI0036774336